MAHLAEDTSDTTSMEFVGRPTPLGERLQTAIDGDLVDIDKTQCVGYVTMMISVAFICIVVSSSLEILINLFASRL